MRIPTVLFCLFLGLALPQLSIAGKKGGGGGKGGKSAHSGGGGGGHRGGGGGGHGGAHANRSGGGGGGGHHGMNAGGHGGGGGGHRNAQGGGAGHQGGKHGLNSRHRAGGGLNGRHQGGNAGLHAHGGNHAVHAGNRFAHRGHYRVAGYGHHWRAAHWRSSYHVFHGYRRVWHDRVWWGSHYDVVVFGGGWGPWYWDSGYWYPAWGYHPGFYFGWDIPIYSYANLPPDQVVVHVQEALQDQGYYQGEVDGQLGQITRDALANYQQDHQLEVTAAIDEPTVQSLGLITEAS